MTKSEFVEIVKPFTMTTTERIESLFDSLELLRLENNLDCDVAECGVWKGGNILGIIKYLQYFNLTNHIWIYDTFLGMTEPLDCDVSFFGENGKNWIGKCDCDLDFVKSILSETKYPDEFLHIVKGDICQTLLEEKNIPKKLSLLRLDTDWYESTKIELELLYPKLKLLGHLIIDDYGHWKGCKKAVDDFFNQISIIPEIEFSDYTCVKIIKKK